MKDKKKIRILSIDGGGIRGIIPATVIKYAEEYLQKKAPGTTIADHFDFITGTSIGGILAALYLMPDEKQPQKAKFSASEALELFVEEGFNIFNKSKIPELRRLWGLLNGTTFSPKHLEKLLELKFENKYMHELLKPCLIPTYDINSRSAFFFNSTDDRRKRKFLLKDVLRSTSAAPTYFPSAYIRNKANTADAEEREMRNIDGGVFANSPALCAYAEARNHHFKDRNIKEPKAEDMYMLSIGTGGGQFSLKRTKISGRWSLLKWAQYIPDIMMDGGVDTTTYQMDAIFKSVREEGEINYKRIDVPTNARDYDSDMSNADPENIQKLLSAGENTVVAARANGLDNFLDGLLDEELYSFTSTMNLQKS